MSIGAASRYGAQEVKELPSISRDIKDVVRIDPKAWVDPTNSDALEIAGVNNRYNTITVDGVRQSDDFGLNNNGYPTQRSPLSVDAIEAVSVLSAPFSVEYSFFRGSTINMVTKSGTNEFTGSAFYYKGDDSLLGDQTKDTDVDLVFDEEIYGGTLGGPIIKDKLFFFLSYEKLEREAPQDIGATGSGFPVEVPDVTQADYDRIRQIGLDVYDFDVGETLASAPEEDEKILAKLDWNINDSHRASLAYQRTEGNELDRQHDQQQPGARPPRRAVELVRPRDPDGNRVPAAVLGLERVLLDRAEARAQGSGHGAGVAVRHRFRRDDHHDAETAARSTSARTSSATPTSSRTTSTRSS